MTGNQTTAEQLAQVFDDFIKVRTEWIAKQKENQSQDSSHPNDTNWITPGELTAQTPIYNNFVAWAETNRSIKIRATRINEQAIPIQTLKEQGFSSFMFEGDGHCTIFKDSSAFWYSNDMARCLAWTVNLMDLKPKGKRWHFPDYDRYVNDFANKCNLLEFHREDAEAEAEQNPSLAGLIPFFTERERRLRAVDSALEKDMRFFRDFIRKSPFEGLKPTEADLREGYGKWHGKTDAFLAVYVSFIEGIDDLSRCLKREQEFFERLIQFFLDEEKAKSFEEMDSASHSDFDFRVEFMVIMNFRLMKGCIEGHIKALQDSINKIDKLETMVYEQSGPLRELRTEASQQRRAVLADSTNWN